MYVHSAAGVPGAVAPQRLPPGVRPGPHHGLRRPRVHRAAPHRRPKGATNLHLCAELALAGCFSSGGPEACLLFLLVAAAILHRVYADPRLFLPTMPAPAMNPMPCSESHRFAAALVSLGFTRVCVLRARAGGRHDPCRG